MADETLLRRIHELEEELGLLAGHMRGLVYVIDTTPMPEAARERIEGSLRLVARVTDIARYRIPAPGERA